MDNNMVDVLLPGPAAIDKPVLLSWKTVGQVPPATPNGCGVTVLLTVRLGFPVQGAAVPELIEANTCDVGILLGPEKAAVALENQASVPTCCLPLPASQLVVTEIGPDAVAVLVPFVKVIVAGVAETVMDSETDIERDTVAGVLFNCVACASIGTARNNNANDRKTATACLYLFIYFPFKRFDFIRGREQPRKLLVREPGFEPGRLLRAIRS